MTRLIDADELLKHKDDHDRISTHLIYNAPTIDAVPSETLYNFIKELGSITYGKERFFRQDNGKWYDREHADYVTLDDVIRRIVDVVRELDDNELYQRELWDRECEDD